MTMDEYDFKKGIEESVAKEKIARRILGVTGGDSLEKIKKAFWFLSMEYHPDKNPGDREAERRFQNIVNAYDFLVKGRRERVVMRDEEGEPRPDGHPGRLDNAWGYYLWWRDSFFDERYGVSSNPGGEAGRSSPFKRLDPNAYEKWYESAEGAQIDAEEKSSLERLLGQGEGKRLLDVGCGTGHFTRWFAGLGYRALGVDVSREFIRYARDYNGSLFAIADGCDLPFADRSFQATVAVTLLEFTRFPECVVREMNRVSESMMAFLLLNQDSELNRKRMEKESGLFAKARFWQPEKARLFIKDVLSDKARCPILQETHEDFYILLAEKE